MSNEIIKADQYLSELDYARKIGDMIVKSGKWAKDWNIDTVAILVLYARDLGIHPVKALMNGFDIIQGKISMKPMFMNEMIRKAGHSIIIEKWGHDECIIKGTRKDNGDTLTIKYTLKDAELAGLLGRDNYKKNPKNMLFARAMGNLGRMLFADIIGGSYAEDEFETKTEKSKRKANSTENLPDAEVEITNIDITPEEPRDPTFEDLQGALLSIGCDTDISLIEEYIKYLSVKKNVPQLEILKSALINEVTTTRFRDCFLESLKPKVETVES
jgi:hypothetical protein